MMLRRQTPRRGSALIETAVVYPVLFLILIGTLIMGIAVFRYQQVSHAAREGARWASVHGAVYSSEQNKPKTTAADVYTNAIKPHLAGTDPSLITYSVSWLDSTEVQSTVTRVTNGGVTTIQSRTNYVTVTVTYTWNTKIFGTIPVRSTAVFNMNY